jgi:hypothetical protein
MSIMDFFRPGTAPAPAATPAQQATPTANGQQQTPPTPSLQATPVVADPTVAIDPMDKFKDLWTPAAKVEGAPEEFNPGNIFKMDPASIQEAVGKINFAEGINADQLAAITAGGEGALAAFAQVLNQSSAKAMALSTQAAGKMIEKALTEASGAMDKKINTGVKHNQVNSQLQELNPALNSPAAAPMVQALTTQLTNKFPMSSAAEISGMVTEYMTNFATIAAGKKEPVVDPVEAGKTDWDAYMQS